MTFWFFFNNFFIVQLYELVSPSGLYFLFFDRFYSHVLPFHVSMFAIICAFLAELYLDELLLWDVASWA